MAARTVALLLALFVVAASPVQGEVRHRITARLDPAGHRLEATDRITGLTSPHLALLLAPTLAVAAVEGAASWRRDPSGPLLLDGPGGEVVVRYAGTLFDPPRPSGHIRFVAGDATGGTISPEGVFLDGGSGWYPDPGGMALFDLDIHLPEPFVAVSQGRLAGRDGSQSQWRATLPADGLTVVAAPFHPFHGRAGAIDLTCYLMRDDPATAKLFLDAAAGYLATLQARLGEYPYPRFDIVENFFSSGYGMPGFTLLGPQVIAMGEQALKPGYLDHEITHNWWGNGVFVDPHGGNWCEGLTSYCANYLAAEGEGEEAAEEARTRWSARFCLDLPAGHAYPLRRFRTKSTRTDDAIGYAKGAALFHQVRRRLGDDRFFAALRGFAHDYLGRQASWDEIEATFAHAGGEPLASLFRPWLDELGGPEVRIERAEAVAGEGGYHLRAAIVQTPPVYPLDVEVAVETTAGEVTVCRRMAGERLDLDLVLAPLPRRLRVDPHHHLFRHLTFAEVAPSLDALLARGPIFYVVAEGDLGVYRDLAEMAQREHGGKIITSAELPAVGGASVWLLGRAAVAPEAAPLLAGHPPDLAITPTTVRLGEVVSDAATAILATWPRPGDPGRFAGLYWGASEAALARAPYCFYYGADSAIRFAHGRPAARLRWPASVDPLAVAVEALR
ncbi:MAG: hypothetical protein COW73_05215 [Nitrospirae bacterium CG18_big_fil_WC_8_21_14_2_50_70_55]|nr:M1 family metallopeptidase [Deltaproteobacteria bacterium]OIP66518.1 MAG: hypothetical protein AUK30_02290 [Nitrospirae bacterium CG2_30_70_394]PIQ05616.1 MAG: hypothetical protein COW73_05215 [Nitrospirae bacterium CG18_big_fil_WC_8_21_14_2_50_70_55]PIU79722.1 MAG: hypothetical protein COS73_02970 [Nitrospirae bacterium CG06_land_8_20_14_3_00_70_43]PIW83441.1 MAG: hypothetical protein COZ96_03430 [Nitrospirae bacterium CG_4_8_14_3_um_filter_70_85]PIX82877.1 MAG: hypothetical protein COZ33_